MGFIIYPFIYLVIKTPIAFILKKYGMPIYYGYIPFLNYFYLSEVALDNGFWGLMDIILSMVLVFGVYKYDFILEEKQESLGLPLLILAGGIFIFCLIIEFVINYHLGKVFGRGKPFCIIMAILSIFNLPKYIFLYILAFDKSDYIGNIASSRGVQNDISEFEKEFNIKD